MYACVPWTDLDGVSYRTTKTMRRHGTIKVAELLAYGLRHAHAFIVELECGAEHLWKRQIDQTLDVN